MAPKIASAFAFVAISSMAVAGLPAPASAAKVTGPAPVVAGQSTSSLLAQCQQPLQSGRIQLGRKSGGPCVRLVQVWLSALSTSKAGGFSAPAIVVDGKYGPMTAGQVRRFQQTVAPRAGRPDGVVGPRTVKAMLDLAG